MELRNWCQINTFSERNFPLTFSNDGQRSIYICMPQRTRQKSTNTANMLTDISAILTSSYYSDFIDSLFAIIISYKLLSDRISLNMLMCTIQESQLLLTCVMLQLQINGLLIWFLLMSNTRLNCVLTSESYSIA
jgi:hypothetical protein